MKKACIILSLLAAFLMLTQQLQAQEAGDLQLTSIKGTILDPQRRELSNYDYLNQGLKYRLMPQAVAELSSLDGVRVFKIQGPGILELSGGQVFLNGKPVSAEQAAGLLSAAEADSGSGKLSGLVMRNADKVVLRVRDKAGNQQNIPLYSGYYALVIGAGNYRTGWPSLPNPAKDAQEVAASLRELGWKVDTLLEPDAESLKQKLNELIIRQGKVEDQGILVWYSGHGHTLVEADGSKLGYIVPVDAPNPHEDELGFMSKGISMRQLETVVRRIRSKHVMMIFDSCFSGAIFALTRAVPSPFIEEKVSKPVRQFITAGTQDEQVPDASVFKTVFIQGVKGREADLNQDGYVTGEELGSYLQEKVVNYSNKNQHPQFGKINNPHFDKGDFVFALPDRTAMRQNPVRPSGKLSAPAERKSKIKLLLKYAAIDLASNRFTSPADNNAFSKYNEVLLLDPLNPEANKGLQLIIGKYVDLAQDRINTGDFERARLFLNKASQVSEADPRVLEVWDHLKKAQVQPASQQASLKSATGAKAVAPQPENRAVVPQPEKPEPAPQRFSKSPNGVVTDHKTKLQWYAVPWWKSYGDAAAAKAKSLEIDGSGWRMPTRKELEGISQKGASQGYNQYLPSVFDSSIEEVWYGEDGVTLGLWSFASGTYNHASIQPIDLIAVRDAPKPGKNLAANQGVKNPQPKAKRGSESFDNERFTRDSDNIITDHKTGLQWLPGPDKDMSWFAADDWVRGLTAKSKGWRLPNKMELEGICRKTGNKNVLPDLFKTSGSWIWSGEARKNNYGPNSGKGRVYDAMIFNVADAEWVSLLPENASSNRAFAVRSAMVSGGVLSTNHETAVGPENTAPTPPPASGARFSKNASGVITDRKTGLQWLLGPDENMNWYEAENWIKEVNQSGAGWRLAQRDEIGGIFPGPDEAQKARQIFKTGGSWIWSGDIYRTDTGSYISTGGVRSVMIFNLLKCEWLRVDPTVKSGNRVFAVRRSETAGAVSPQGPGPKTSSTDEKPNTLPN